MACSLVPPLNCSCFHQTPQAKSRGSVSFYVQCVSSRMTAVIDFERMQIPTLDVHSSYFTATGPLGYEGDTGPPAKTDLEAIMPTEALLTSEEATIAAAAAEAIALARAAVEVAKEAAQMKGNEPSSILNNLENFQAEKFRLSETTSETQNQEEKVTSNPSSDEGISLLLHNELSLQEIQESKRVTVRSRRQTERRAKRAKAATKAANGVVSVKSGSFSKKKGAAVQEVDYSDPLYYLRRMTNTSKLLTASEELELSEGIQDLVKLERLQEELRNGSPGLPTFAQWASAVGVDERTLRKRLAKGKHCKDKMIKSNIRLVISIAKNFQGAGMNLQDLVQEGCRGLVKGAEKFDASKGFKFSTYAHWWIKQAVRRSLSEQSRTIRLPFHMVEATYRVREARKQLYSEHGRYPDNEEVAKAAGLTMKRLNAVMLTPKAPRSLDQKIGIDMNLKPSEVIADPDALMSEEILVKQIVRHDLNKVLDSLSPREKQVIRCRFGLGDGRMKTLQEIGELIGVSRERIRQIESCAFRKLKNKKRNKSLRQHLIP